MSLAPAAATTTAATGAAAANAVVAVTAVNRTIAPGLEGDLGLLAALGTDHREHFPTIAGLVSAAATAAGAITTAIALVPTGCTTSGTALGLIGVALLRMVRLIVGGEGERLSTLNARKGP